MWLFLVFAGCSEPPDPGGAAASPKLADVSHDRDLQPIWDRECVSCHAGHRDGRLSLMAGEGRDHLLGPSSQARDLPIVVPGDADGSYLLAKLEGRALDFPGGHNTPMPPVTLLPPDEIALVEAWIEAGAPE